MYAQVVVLTYQPPTVDSYTYEIPKGLNLKIGQLVEVPFGKRNPQGIVLSITDSRSPTVKNIKLISKIVLENPILLPYQIELLKWMSTYYIASTVNCLEAMLPQIPKRAADIQNVGKSSQTLILTPSINKIAETLAKFPMAKNHIVYHNELKASERFTTWQRIATGHADYIFSSRAGVFVPCPNLKEIIIYDEHDGAYKDERSPYYDTLTVAQKISVLTGAVLKIVDPSPKVATYFQLKNHIKIQKFNQEVTVVNMQNEKLSGRRSPISFDLEQEILNTDGNILLFLNKKKESGHIFCKECKTSTYLDKQPNECPNCKSPDIFWNILNIDSLKAEAKKLFPKKKIEVNTAVALYSPLLKKYDLVAHIQTDSLLSLADYSSSESLFAQIVQLKKLLRDDGKLVIQTYNVEHSTITAIEKSDYQSFYDSEIKQRKLLGYPPFSVLIKLTFKGKTDQKIKHLADEMATKLGTSYQSLVTVLGPYKPVFWQRVPTYHIILKYKIEPSTSKDKAIGIMSAHLEKGSKNYTIEVEPSSIQ